MAKLLVLSFGPNKWVMDNSLPTRQPLVCVQDGMQDVSAFSMQNYKRIMDKDGNVVESGEYCRIGCPVSIKDRFGHKAKAYSALSMAEFFAKAVYDRLGFNLLDDLNVFWTEMEDTDCFYQNEACVQFYLAATNEFIVGIDVRITNPHLKEDAPSIVYGRRDTEYLNENPATYKATEYYTDSASNKVVLLDYVVDMIKFALNVRANAIPSPFQYKRKLSYKDSNAFDILCDHFQSSTCPILNLGDLGFTFGKTVPTARPCCSTDFIMRSIKAVDESDIFEDFKAKMYATFEYGGTYGPLYWYDIDKDDEDTRKKKAEECWNQVLVFLNKMWERKTQQSIGA